MVRSPPKLRVSFHRIADVAAGFCAGLTLALACVAVAGSPAPRRVEAAAPSVTVAGPGVRATALKVIDGDTFEARVAAFPGQEIVTRIRIDGVDAPERRGRCASETKAADAAATALAALVEDRELTLTEVWGDKYFGRVVARVSSAGVGDVAQALVRGGHGRAYAGGRRDGWC